MEAVIIRNANCFLYHNLNFMLHLILINLRWLLIKKYWQRLIHLLLASDWLVVSSIIMVRIDVQSTFRSNYSPHFPFFIEARLFCPLPAGLYSTSE